MIVKCIDPASDPLWLSLLDQPAAGLFHSPPWLRALADAYGFPIQAYIATDETGSALGGVAFSEIDDLLGRRIAVLPFSDTCDPIVASEEVWRLLFGELQSHGVPVQLRCLTDHFAPADESVRITRRARWHRIPLTSPPDFRPCTRRAIRKAERCGVQVRPLLDIDSFRRLHVVVRKRKYQMLAQPPAFFEALQRCFGEVNSWFPLGAFLGERLIAATVYLRWRDTLYYKFNASDLDALDVRPNNLLVRAGMELAHSLGCTALDLGPSDDDQPGLIRFKRNFGAREYELKFLSWTQPDGRSHEGATEIRRLLGDMTRLVTAPEVTDASAGRAGSLLYRFFA